jgi:hypothetical protein
MLTGKLAERDGKLFVVYDSPMDMAPKLHRLWWEVYQIKGNAWNAYRPEAGDTVRSQMGGDWTASREGVASNTGSVWFPSGLQARHIEEIDVPCPKVRKGIETRWYQGAWQKYSKAEGWIPA